MPRSKQSPGFVCQQGCIYDAVIVECLFPRNKHCYAYFGSDRRPPFSVHTRYCRVP